MHPYLLRAGELSLPAYPVIYGLGITLASIVIVLLGARQGLNVRKLAHVSLFTALAVVIGGRAFYVLQHPPKELTRADEMLLADELVKRRRAKAIGQRLGLRQFLLPLCAE